MPMLTFDLQDTSVSIPGSLLAITGVGERTPSYRRRTAAPGAYLRCIRSRDEQNFIFHLIPTRAGKPLADAVWVGEPGAALVRAGDDWLSLRFTSPTELVLEGVGLGLQLHGLPGWSDWLRALTTDRWRYTVASRQVVLDLIRLAGEVAVDAPWDVLHSTRVEVAAVPDAARHWKLVLREREAQVAGQDQAEPGSWDAAADFAAWAEPLVAGLADRQTALVAAHALWAHQCRPDGLLPGRAIIAGKAWMPAAYGWDQCFCAAGIAHAHPDLAWEQLALFFHAQRADGCLPASLAPDRVSWTTRMPPLQGWCLRRLRQVPGCVTGERLAWILPRLERYVRWWLSRDLDGDGAPEYEHGFDSGWDNASCFQAGPCVASPDLLAFLSDCCLALAEGAETLGEPQRAAAWRGEDARLAELANRRFVVGDRLVARSLPSGEVAPGDSLMPWLGLRFGLRLAEPVRRRAVAALGDPRRFLAAYGPATESLSSPFLTEDGYWRGPVWAPTTWLMAEALTGIGERSLADDLLTRFCRACAQDGMAENFDGTSGRGLRDRTYAWTAAVYLLAQRALPAVRR